jgi:hypothetical protein
MRERLRFLLCDGASASGEGVYCGVIWVARRRCNEDLSTAV